ncbi:MAG: rhodanese-like domain-containing protein [Hyphomicrobiaceae bacterium]
MPKPEDVRWEWSLAAHHGKLQQWFSSNPVINTMPGGATTIWAKAWRAGLALCLLAALGIAPLAAETGAGRMNLRSAALDLVEAQIRTVFDDVPHISQESLVKLLQDVPGRVVLLDVRGAEEHAVSRLPGAIHVMPETRSAAEVVARAGSLEGKIVVAYCSIGLRSSRLLVEIGQALKEKGAVELHNLAGGAFRWRNDGRQLVGASGPTRAIHPYSVLWRQFLLDQPNLPAAGDK